MIPMLILNMGSGLFSMYYKLRGPNVATCSACATSDSRHRRSLAHASKWAMRKAMFAGGSEATIVPTRHRRFLRDESDEHAQRRTQAASRPFDKDRDGFVMGEGAGVVVLEELEHAKARGAKIYAELIGYGNTADANHITAPAPEGEGAARCMKMALRTAGLNPTDISYINAHGTSTPQGDIAETQAIKTVFGDHARKAGRQLHQRRDRPHARRRRRRRNGHLRQSDRNKASFRPRSTWTTRIRNVIWTTFRTPRAKMPVNAIVNNSFGFGGHNATIVAKKFVG